jgi:hypothetical protein
LVGQNPPPAVLHLTGGFVPTGSGVGLDLTGGWGSAVEGSEAAPAALTTTDLDRAVRAAAQDWPAPIVVLDAVATAHSREAAIQLVLRNAFAAELFALGGTRAVLAMGLALHDDKTYMNALVAGGLAEGRPLGAIVRDVRRSLVARGRHLGFAGVALWCDDPRIMLPGAR